jgi:hypothetical protein
MVLGAAVAATSMTAISTPAAARDSFAIDLNLGNVRFGYRDGYYDHYGRWHRWESPRHVRYYREYYGDRYWDRPARYYPNRGWRDSDRDGVPNRYDRDRDGDGVPNRYDWNPNNPWVD